VTWEKDYIVEQACRLRLLDWDIDLSWQMPEVVPAGHTDAYVTTNLENQQATIYLGPVRGDDKIKHLIQHELAHILLADMAYVACNGRSVDIMEVYNMLEERVCNALADALT
jgi:hypothetical protein